MTMYPVERRTRAAAEHSRSRALASYLVSAVLLLVSAAAAASEPAGRVLFTTGEVTAEEGNRVGRPLTRHDVVYPGETVRTAAAAHVQLRMRDDALLALGPDSRLTLDRYASNGSAGSVILRFLRGTLRTVTGAIGKRPVDTYRMVTPVGIIGVRGTRYAIELCEARCARASRPTGLYGHVGAGAIVVSNDAGSLVLARNEYFHVAARDVAPRRLEELPDAILDDIPTPAKAGASEPPLALGSGELLTDNGGLLTGEDGLLAEDGALLTTTDTLLDTGGSLLQTTGGALTDVGGALEGSGGLAGTAGGALEQGGGAIEDIGGSLATGDTLLDTTNDVVDESGDLLDGTSDLLQSDDDLLQ